MFVVLDDRLNRLKRRNINLVEIPSKLVYPGLVITSLQVSQQSLERPLSSMNLVVLRGVLLEGDVGKMAVKVLGVHVVGLVVLEADSGKPLPISPNL